MRNEGFFSIGPCTIHTVMIESLVSYYYRKCHGTRQICVLLYRNLSMGLSKKVKSLANHYVVCVLSRSGSHVEMAAHYHRMTIALL